MQRAAVPAAHAGGSLNLKQRAGTLWLLTVGGLQGDVAVACGAQACGVQLGVGALLLGREASQLLAWEAV